jgi:hypothetical protein
MEEQEERGDELERDHDAMRGHEGERDGLLLGRHVNREGGAKDVGPIRATQAGLTEPRFGGKI